MHAELKRRVRILERSHATDCEIDRETAVGAAVRQLRSDLNNALLEAEILEVAPVAICKGVCQSGSESFGDRVIRLYERMSTGTETEQDKKALASLSSRSLGTLDMGPHDFIEMYWRIFSSI
ncbi:hypothetical protein [Noviherbaspirillum galbum]|uniref:Uncharacterized protein n=1 Tax=Noviherbaspirillum galbum TaxID=2709383 RepID=A0A6B3SNL6_9BURK|nr:hypothetical protein [Noviherbaspirillum galbum]NEX62470.1 hypothetical protein [Noviherbaspirillum galbum]